MEGRGGNGALVLYTERREESEGATAKAGARHLRGVLLRKNLTQAAPPGSGTSRERRARRRWAHLSVSVGS
jgi:hypothetical protein